jgi:transcriptional regulator with XRE-family HTH domain
MSIKERLKQIIENKKLNITEFASICEIPYNTLQNYLLGRRTIGIDAVTKINVHLNINSNWLLTGQEEMYRTETTTEEIPAKWLSTWWDEADEEHRHWLNIQMKRQFPEYAEWCEQEEKKDKEN